MKKFSLTVVLVVAWSVLSLGQGKGKQVSCGTERWTAKSSLTGVNPRPAQISISTLTSLQAPTKSQLQAAGTKRLPEETTTYEVKGLLVGYKLESDSDFHIVIADPDNPRITMIVEMVAPGCTKNVLLRRQTSQLRMALQKKFGVARASFKRVPGKPPVTVTGPLFFDFAHGQTGVAKNAVELHPVVDFKF